MRACRFTQKTDAAQDAAPADAEAEAGPAFTIRETAFPDLRVQKVTAFPTACGKWQEVTSFPDFKVQVVTAFEDFQIQYTTAFPGIP